MAWRRDKMGNDRAALAEASNLRPHGLSLVVVFNRHQAVLGVLTFHGQLEWMAVDNCTNGNDLGFMAWFDPIILRAGCPKLSFVLTRD
jgi:hypothetical protein